MKLMTLQDLRLYKEKLSLSQTQKDFLIGTILGDGNL